MGLGVVTISKELMAEFLKGSYVGHYKSNAPQDMEVVAVRECPQFHPDAFEVVVRSSLLPDPPEMAQPEHINITFTRDAEE